MKPWVRVVAAAIVLLILALGSILFLVNANTFRPLLETQLTGVLGRQVSLGNLRFSPLSGSLVADNLSIADDPSFSKTPFLTAKQLKIGVEMRPLLFSRLLRVRSFEAEKPQIHLIRARDGSWNFSSIGQNTASRTGSAKLASPLPGLTVGIIAVRDGRAVVQSLENPGPPHVYDHLNLSTRQFSLAKRFPFSLSASLQGDGEVTVSGNAGPINRQDAAMTAVDAKISVKHLDPVRAGFLDPNLGVSMLADMNAHATSDGRVLSSEGTVRMRRLQLVKTGTPAPKPVDLTYKVAQHLKDSSGNLKSADIEIGNAAIRLNGTYRLIPDDPSLNVKLAGQSLPIEELQMLMQSAGVQLPNGSTLKGGTLTLALTIVGQINDLAITGPVELDNTQLVGFDLGSKISGIAALGRVKTGDTTAIQTLRLDLLTSDAGIKADNIYSVLPALGAATGSGTVSPSGALAFRLAVKVTSARGLGKAGAGLLTKLNGLAGSTGTQAPASGVPMLVTGTANNPVITTDVKGLMHRNAAALLGKAKKHNPGTALKHLFGKKN